MSNSNGFSVRAADATLPSGQSGSCAHRTFGQGTRTALSRRLWLAYTLVLVCVVGALAAGVYRGNQSSPQGHFTIGQVHAFHGRARAGLVVLVRGAATTCADEGLACPSIALDLPTIAYIGLPSSSALLQVALGESGGQGGLSALHALPAIGRFVPDPGDKVVLLLPEHGSMGRLGTFRIRLLARPQCRMMQAYICYDGVLLGATP